MAAWSNLRAVFHRELEAWAAEGGTIEEPFKAACFINRGGVRYVVTLSRDLTYRGGPAQPPGAEPPSDGRDVPPQLGAD